MVRGSGKLFIVGFGPGSFQHMTDRAKEAIQESDVIIGYNTYVDLIRELLQGQEIVRTGMTEEVSRAIEAVRQAELGKKVAVISSGDAGVYGMAGLVYEVLVEKGWREADGVQVEVIPGISAINSCASLLGAPVMHDFCCISLSDHLTPWELIASRVEAAGQGDFIVALYNPRSGKRTRQIVETQKILLKYRSSQTPVGLVKSAYRERQSVIHTTLGDMLDHDIGMLTTVIIGNRSTFVYDGKMITPRGYQRKYTLDRAEQPLLPGERLREQHEPWALHQGVSETERQKKSPHDWAMEAMSFVTNQGVPANVNAFATLPAILELAVSPGVGNKKFTPAQMSTILDVIGADGEIEYTPHHYVLIRLMTTEAEQVAQSLREAQLIVQPVGNVVQVKACDFCNGEKTGSIPQAEELASRVAGVRVPKELKIGFAGCAMACYSSINEDIAVVYRKNRFDLFLGGKSIGRNAHPAQLVAEGVAVDELVDIVERIVLAYQEQGYPEERFHKFWKRVGEVAGYRHESHANPVVADASCGE